MIDCSTPLVCEVIARATRSLCDTAYVFRCRVNETDSCDASPWVIPLPAQRCRAIRDKIARIRKATGKTIPTFGPCKA